MATILKSGQVWVGIVVVSVGALAVMGWADGRSRSQTPNGDNDTNRADKKADQEKLNAAIEQDVTDTVSHDGGKWYLRGVSGTTEGGVVYAYQVKVYTLSDGTQTVREARAVKSAGAGGIENTRMYGPDVEPGQTTSTTTNPVTGQPLPSRWMTTSGTIHATAEEARYESKLDYDAAVASGRGAGVAETTPDTTMETYEIRDTTSAVVGDIDSTAIVYNDPFTGNYNV